MRPAKGDEPGFYEGAYNPGVIVGEFELSFRDTCVVDALLSPRVGEASPRCQQYRARRAGCVVGTSPAEISLSSWRQGGAAVTKISQIEALMVKVVKKEESENSMSQAGEL